MTQRSRGKSHTLDKKVCLQTNRKYRDSLVIPTLKTDAVRSVSNYTRREGKTSIEAKSTLRLIFVVLFYA